VNYLGFSAFTTDLMHIELHPGDLTASEASAFGSQKSLPALFRSWEAKQKTKTSFQMSTHKRASISKSTLIMEFSFC
jgi:hypothetical protein